MRTTKEIIEGTEENPLMVLERHEFGSENFDIKEAYEELLAHSKKEKAITWGYFPGLEAKEMERYPRCIKLAYQLRSLVPLPLAFIRLVSQKPDSEYGGMHIDVHPGVNHVKDPAHRNDEVARVLINLHRAPRLMRYVPIDRDSLIKQGINISPHHYQIIKEQLPIKEIEIPPITNTFMYSLKFWSSLLPHEGVTDDQGSFIASYGNYFKNPQHYHI
ncbi:hypothetical protein KW805_03905 [Candidatus Pacearchaeota archaeon]|nr:hypothetical protein [Candidatus Pacearchaeota archaeon]